MSNEEKPIGRAIGAKAKLDKMTDEQKKAHSQKMLAAKAIRNNLPKSLYKGEITIGDITLRCDVLDNGMRVLRETDIYAAIATGTGGKIRSMRSKLQEERGIFIPLFFASKPLEPYIEEVFGTEKVERIEYIDTTKNKIIYGFEATILPKICEVWLRAKDADVLQKNQLSRVRKAEILMRGLAQVGIIALVDEATGYQDYRAKNALAEILEAFVAKELRPWLHTFPLDFYKELCRLYGVPFPPPKNNQFPSFFGHITNNAIYERLAPGLLPELKKAANKEAKKVKLHQFLTKDVGHPKLKDHLVSVVTLLKISKNKEEFYSHLDRVHPKLNSTIPPDL